MRLPLKTRILQYAIDSKCEFTLEDIIRDLESEYKGERIFSSKQVEEYVDSYLGVGFLNAERTNFANDGKLIVHYKVTEYGLSRKKYIES